MADRDELVRRAGEAISHFWYECEAGEPPSIPITMSTGDLALAHAVLDALGLTEETVWTDDGDPEVQRRSGGLSFDFDEPEELEAAEEHFRRLGWKLKRRYVTEWEDITDADR